MRVNTYVFTAGTGDSNVVWNVTQCRVAAVSHTVSEQLTTTIFKADTRWLKYDRD